MPSLPQIPMTPTALRRAPSFTRFLHELDTLLDLATKGIAELADLPGVSAGDHGSAAEHGGGRNARADGDVEHVRRTGTPPGLGQRPRADVVPERDRCAGGSAEGWSSTCSRVSGAPSRPAAQAAWSATLCV